MKGAIAHEDVELKVFKPEPKNAGCVITLLLEIKIEIFSNCATAGGKRGSGN